MKIFLVIKLFVLIIMVFVTSCLTVQETFENAEIKSSNSKVNNMNSISDDSSYTYSLSQKEIEKMNSRFWGAYSLQLELIGNNVLLLRFRNDTDSGYWMPYFRLHFIDACPRSNGKRNVIYGSIHIDDVDGNDLLESEIMVDINIYHIITEDECLWMNSGDEYLYPVPLNELIDMEKLIGTGTEIKIYYGELEEHQSNVVTLTL